MNGVVTPGHRPPMLVIPVGDGEASHQLSGGVAEVRFEKFYPQINHADIEVIV